MTASNDEVPSTAHGPRLSHGMPAVRKGSGGLLALVLCLPPGLGSVAVDEHRPPCGSLVNGKK